MKKNYRYLLLLLAVLSSLVIYRCKKENDKNNQLEIPKNAPIGIYMAGQKSSSAKSLNLNEGNSSGCIWVNGVQYDMGDVWIDDVKVFNDTIYCCGHNFSGPGNTMMAYYYIGDQEHKFNVSISGSDICSIWVDAKAVYIAGQDSSKPCYWINGIKHNLPSEGILGTSNDIIIKNKVIYCGGNVSPKYIRGCYWINDQIHFLDDGRLRGGNISTALGMFINGSDVYIAGTCDGNKGYDEACYWKNGIKQDLSFTDMEFLHNTINGSIQISEADDIYIYNGDVYVSGRYIFGDLNQNYQRVEMCYWKNNESRTDITDFQKYVRPKIVVDAEAKYFIADTTFWINDKQVPIENQENYTISSIFLYEYDNPI
jgi:hypothetical protein